MERPGKILFDKPVLDCLNPHALAEFYSKLLGWGIGYDTPEFAIIGSPDCGTDIGFQKNEDYVPPVWPEAPGAQQQMQHLDFSVPSGEMQAWKAYAIECGAKAADFQYSSDWIVMLDPEGHPFCLDGT